MTTQDQHNPQDVQFTTHADDTQAGAHYRDAVRFAADAETFMMSGAYQWAGIQAQLAVAHATLFAALAARDDREVTA